MWILVTVAAIALAVMLAFAFGRRHARRLQRETGVRIERFKMKRRHDEIALEVFGSREVIEAIKGYARARRIAVAEAERQARSYLDEILPRFNLLAYYRIATPLSAGVLKTLYRIIVDKGPLRHYGDRVPKGTTVVWVLNHRSDLDPFLVTYALSRYVSVSYAVGEWAQFWPLNQLFRLCGAYFIRRRYRETLYHAILKVFVQTITRNGVTQAFFIEGGLSRDGAF
ncbi:MAG: 1-acyl-sn-glycerol-3-phosphate acyltransferase [Acidobacteria bacterium]|nr:1-acyl-sn-glycerol-3-phosphate acyltransferase [Acidobacteriota bacterium]